MTRVSAQLTVVIATDPFRQGLTASMGSFNRLIRSALLYGDRLQIANIGYAVSSPARDLEVDISAPPSTGKKGGRKAKFRLELKFENEEWLDDWGLVLVPQRKSDRQTAIDDLKKVLEGLEPARERQLIVPLEEGDEHFRTTVIENDFMGLMKDDPDAALKRMIAEPLWLSGTLNALSQPGVVALVDGDDFARTPDHQLRLTEDQGLRREVELGSAFLTALPSFDQASIAEVLDIRGELEGPLVRFRSAMSAMAAEISSPDPQTIDEAAQQLWVQEIAPSIAEVEELIQENRYLLRLADRFTDKTAMAGVVGLAACITKFSGLAEVISASAVGTMPFLLAARDRWMHQRQIAQRNELYLLSAVKRRLRKKR